MSGYSGSGYPIAPVSNGKAIGMPLTAPRVTDIVKTFGDIPAQALGYSGMKIGADAAAKLAAEGFDFSTADAATLYEAMKKTGINPPAVWGAKRDLGTIAHDTLEYFLRNGEWPFVQEDAAPYVEAGKAWIAKYLDGAEILGIEERLWNPAPFFCGTPDLIFRDVEGRFVIADWKTSKQISLDYLLQLAFYAVAAMTHGLCREWPILVCVLLLPNGKYKEQRSPLTSTHVWNAYRSWEAKEQAKREVAA